MKYFAYGSNMSISRFRKRVPGARRMGCYCLKGYDLRFHKLGKDGSGKCDAYFTGKSHDCVIGALFEIAPDEKRDLDKVEGLGYGYEEKRIIISDQFGFESEATTYYATNIDESLKPYSWYLNHVLIGARESGLPQSYVDKIEAVAHLEDQDEVRDRQQRAIHT